MAKKLLPDDLWAEIAPLMPCDPPRPKGGRPPVEAREALIGILFVLYTGIPWERLPYEVAGCSGMTCWRRLRTWQDIGLWDRLHRHMLDRLNLAGEIDWSRVGGLLVRCRQKGGDATGPNPTDRGRPGTKRHIMVDRAGLPLSIILTGANRHDSMVLADVVDAVHPVRNKLGRPRKRPAKLHADKGYDFDRCRRDLRNRGITPRIARRGVESSKKLGKHRWVVERTFAWINRFRRLTIRYERHADLYRAFTLIAAAIICFNAKRRFC